MSVVSETADSKITCPDCKSSRITARKRGFNLKLALVVTAVLDVLSLAFILNQGLGDGFSVAVFIGDILVCCVPLTILGMMCGLFGSEQLICKCEDCGKEFVQ